jgi:hypothetical protein
MLAGTLDAQQASAAPAAPRPRPPACADQPVRRQFDFWIGTWDVYPWAAPVGTAQPIGQNVITAIEAHCALLEEWTSARGTSGRSFNWYDQNLLTWRQLWIDQSGSTLDYTRGEFRDNAMHFRGWTRGPNGVRTEQKLAFILIHVDTVRQLFEASTDSGRTWASTFDARYIRRRP